MDDEDKEVLLRKIAPELRPQARALLPLLSTAGLSETEIVVTLASAAAELKEQWDETLQDYIPPVPLSPQDHLRAEYVERWLRPWAERVRTELFGTPEPPFSSMAEAANWIEEEYARTQPALKSAYRSLQEQTEAMARAKNALEQPPFKAFQIKIDVTPASLTYLAPDGTSRAISAMGSEALSRLVWTARQMEAVVGWSDTLQATTYLLLGVAAPVPHLVIGRSTSSWEPGVGQTETLHRREAVLTIRGSDLSHDELGELWRRLRRQGVTEKKPLKGHHLEVWRFVTDRRGQGSTWPQVLAEWNADPLHKPYVTVRGLEKAFKRAEKKARMGAELPGEEIVPSP